MTSCWEMRAGPRSRNGGTDKHVCEQELVEQVTVALLEDIEVDVLLKRSGFRAQLEETAVNVVCFAETGGNEVDGGVKHGAVE
jgi:hypothetical protein